MFREKFRGRARYSPGYATDGPPGFRFKYRIGWEVFDGTQWTRNEKAVDRMVMDIGDSLIARYPELADVGDPGMAKAVYRLVRWIHSHGGSRWILNRAKMMKGIKND